MTLNDIVNSVYFRTQTNASNFPAASMLIFINNAYERVASLIQRVDDRWQWDDSNETDLPIATTALVANQQDYSIPVSFLTIDRVEILTQINTWLLLVPIDPHDVKLRAMGQYLNVPGTPRQYDKIANSIFLYPTPNYGIAGGLKIYYTRAPIAFTSSDLSTGTAVPGFNSLFHDLIPLWVSYEYSVANKPQNAAGFMKAIQAKEQDLNDFYGSRSRDERPRMMPSTNMQVGTQSGVITQAGYDSNR